MFKAQKNITTDQALKIGQYLISVPIVMITIGTLGFFWYLVAWGSIHWIFGPLSFIISPVAGWVYWSLTITQWRIWAFRRVERCQELKALAIDIGLISRDDSFLERTEFRTPRQQSIIDVIEYRLCKQPCSYIEVDDQKSNAQTEFKYDKSGLIIALIQYLFIISIGIYLVVTLENSLYGSIVGMVGILLSGSVIQKIAYDTPSLIINHKGISINREMLEWESISNVSARMDGRGKSRNAYLFYDIDGSTLWLNLADYNLTLTDLKNELRNYKTIHKDIDLAS